MDATSLRLLGTDLRSGGERLHRHFLGTSLSMVFQDPGTSFNPTRRVGGQLAEVGRYHLGMSRTEAHARAVDRLRAVHVPAPERRAGQYPHEFSGGMRQRAMIGMGLMGSPALIIADEPTTALDVTIQKQVLSLLQSIREADGVALLLISHDVAVVRQVCDRVLVMYAGRIVEDLPAAELVTGARHPYTRALVAAVPDMESDRDRPLAVDPGPTSGAIGGAARVCLCRTLPAGRPALPGPRSRPRGRRGRTAGRLLARRGAARPRDAGRRPGHAPRLHLRQPLRPARARAWRRTRWRRHDGPALRGRQRPLREPAPRRDRRRPGQPGRAAGERRGPGRGIGLRQVHPGPGRGGHRAAARRAHPVRRGAPPDEGPTTAADGLPGPLLLPRPADDDRRVHRRGAAAGHELGPSVARRSSACSGSSTWTRRARGSTSPSLGRAAAARGPGACPGRPTGCPHRRRDHLGPGRLHPGGRAQPGARAAARAGPVDPLHLPQPGRGALRGRATSRSCTWAASWSSGRRGGPGRSAASLHARPAGRHPGRGADRRRRAPSTCWRPSTRTTHRPGCRYHTRCPVGPAGRPPDREVCRLVEPTADHRQSAACHFAQPTRPATTEDRSTP